MGLVDYSSLGVSPKQFVESDFHKNEEFPEQNETDISSLGLTPKQFMSLNEQKNTVKEEPLLKSGIRTAIQPVKALAYRFAGVPNLVLEGAKALSSATAGAEIPEDIRELQAQYPEQAEEIERNFREGAKKAVEYLPSVSTGMGILEKAGVPTEAKTPFQKGVNIASLAALGIPGQTTSEAATSALVSTTLYEYLTKIGVPEQISEGISLLVGGFSSNQPAPQASLDGRKVSKTGSIPTESSSNISKKISSSIPIEGSPPIKSVSIGRPTKNLAFEETKQNPRGPFAAGTEAKELATKKYEKISVPSPFEIKTPGKTLEAKPIEESKVSGLVKTKLATETEAPESLGLSEIKKPVFKEKMPEEDVSDYIIDPVSKLSVSDKSKAGKRLKDIFSNIQENKLIPVNKKYAESRELNSGEIEDRQELYSKLDRRVKDSESLPSYYQDADINKKIKDIRDSLVKIDKETGDIEEFLPFSNQELIDLAQDLRKKVQYDFAYDKSNVYYKIIDEIEDEILRTAQANPKAYKSYLDAKNAYREWAETYNNDYIKPFLDKSNKDYIKLFDSLKKEDNYNVLGKILEKSGPNSSNYASSLKREIIESKIGKNFNDLTSPQKAPQALKEIQKSLDELTIPISAEEKKAILDNCKNIAVKARSRAEIEKAEAQQVKEYEEAVKEREKIISAQKKDREAQLEEIAKKRTEKLKQKISKDALKDRSPESIWEDMQSISGLRKIEAQVKKKNPQSLKDFEKLKKEAGIYNLYHGKIGEGKIRSVETVLENAKNVEFLEETLGKDVVKKWQETIAKKKNYDQRLAKYEKEIEKLKKQLEKSSSEEARKGVEKTLSQKILEQGILFAKREVLDRSLFFLPYSLKAPVIESILKPK